MRLSRRLAAAALSLGLPAAAHAQCPPSGSAFDLSTKYFAFARVNGTVLDFSCLITAGDDGIHTLAFGSASPVASYAMGGTTALAYLSSFSVTFDPWGTSGTSAAGDPGITWSIATRTALRADRVADPTFDFAFAFGMPVTRRSYATASASAGFSISNANARTTEGVSLTPAGGFAPLPTPPASFPVALFGAAGPLARQSVYEQILTDGVVASGIGAGTDPCQLADPNPTARARQRVCDFATDDQPLGATVGSVGMVVQYRQFGAVNGSITGSMTMSPPAVTIAAVPEPASVVLTASGLVGLLGGAIARRRRQA